MEDFCLFAVPVRATATAAVEARNPRAWSGRPEWCAQAYSIACVSTGTVALRGMRISNSSSSAGKVVAISST
jgi:hypothetical protein